ncbi:monofunctional biosynthetic peptidoglycan transglycosylase [Thermodesulfobacterium sp. TA1]|nr:monofunctional biosynthetic peptidoglycan transglycosylase [Thermodesulfobacterium sp. TA1]
MKTLKLLFLSLGIGFLGYLVGYPLLVDVSSLKTQNPKLTAMMKYRMKQWEKEGKKVQIRQIWVPLSSISPYLIKAVLIGEDDKFYRHEGFDFEGIKKALEKNLKEGKLKYGGSTISQQLAKNLYLSPSKNPIRKIQEAIITLRLEKTLSKKRILEIYLNVAEWGEGIFGAEAAAKHYYGKSAKNLTPWEAARLVAVLPNPLKYNPLGNQPYVEKRSRLIYFIMKKRGIIKEEYKNIENETEDITEPALDSLQSETPEEKPTQPVSEQTPVLEPTKEPPLGEDKNQEKTE